MHTLFVTIGFIICCYSQPYDYYVSSKNGNDNTGNGTKSNPFRTIQMTQNKVRSLIPTLSKASFNQNITINIDNSGYYMGINPITLEDSLIGFSNKNFIIYQATNTYEPPSIYGGCVIINSSQWTKMNTINGLTLFKTNLKSVQNNLPSPTGLIFEIFMNGIRMNATKSPLYRYSYLNSTSKVIETDSQNITNIKELISTDYVNNLMVLAYEDWTSSYHFVKNISFNALTNKINITLVTSPHTWVNDPGSGNRFYLLNNQQFLTLNNSFYFNKTSFDLFILLNKTELDSTDEIILPNKPEILKINPLNSTTKVERILFKNLDFKYTSPDFSTCFNGSCMGPGQSAANLPTAAIHTLNVDTIIFDRVNISNTGGFALWLGEGSINCEYKNGYINNLGAGGIRIGPNAGGNVSINRTAINISIHNNYILNGGHIFEAGPGILAGPYRFSNITNNEIAHFKQTGISSGCNSHYGATPVKNNYIGRNMIYDLGKFVLSDMGCIYTDGEQQNCVYDNNICHDVYSFNYGGWGIYSDQATRFAIFKNNIVYNTKCAGNHQHFGLDNIFVNNIYAFPELIYPTADGAVRSSQHAGNCSYNKSNNYNPGACSSFTFITNIVYVKDTWGYDILWDEYNTYWKNITLDGNTYWSVKQKTAITFPDNYTIKQWVAEGKDVQHAIADPLFVDPDNYNFDLQPGSPAIGMGFHQINTEIVGPNW